MLDQLNNCKIVASTGFENHFLFFVFGINLICKTHFPLSLFTSVNHFHFHELEKNIFPAWAMGASTGHTAVALWRDGSLQVRVIGGSELTKKPICFHRSASQMPSRHTGQPMEFNATHTWTGLRWGNNGQY